MLENKYRKMFLAVPKEAQKIMQAYTEFGQDIFLVGGCCRDVLLSRDPHDFDMCTNAAPDMAYKIIDWLNLSYETNAFSVVPTGIEYGTVTVLFDDGCNKEAYEITTFREDAEYSDGRRPDKITFSTKVEDDLARRDFTINAIAFNPSRGFVDPFRGIQDCEKKIIRTVGNPNDRFNEDGLRILRALRFAAQLGFHIEEKTSKAIHDCKYMLDNVSKERIHSELCKILMGDYCCSVLTEYKDVLVYIIPEINEKLIDVSLNTVHHLQYRGEKDIVTMLAGLLCSVEDFGYSAENTYKVLRGLKFSNEVTEHVAQLIGYRFIDITNEKPYIKELLNEIGEEQLRRLFILHTASIMAQYDFNPSQFQSRTLYFCLKMKTIRKCESLLDEIIENNECYSLKQLAVNGDDLITVGIPQGEMVGRILKELLNAVIEDKIENDREQLLQAAINAMDNIFITS